MATPQNIGSVNASESKNYFNNYFLNLGTVSSDRDEAVLGYFEKYTKGNKAAAEALASAVIYTAIAQNMDPMSILDQFIRMPVGQLNAYLTMFLNLNRIGTSFLGVNNQPIVNKYIKRAIMI